jgi:hypothetical protein
MTAACLCLSACHQSTPSSKPFNIPAFVLLFALQAPAQGITLVDDNGTVFTHSAKVVKCPLSGKYKLRLRRQVLPLALPLPPAPCVEAPLLLTM